MSWFKYRNLSVIVNCNNKHLYCDDYPHFFINFICLVFSSMVWQLTNQDGYVTHNVLQISTTGQLDFWCTWGQIMQFFLNAQNIYKPNLPLYIVECSMNALTKFLHCIKLVKCFVLFKDLWQHKWEDVSFGCEIQIMDVNIRILKRTSGR